MIFMPWKLKHFVKHENKFGKYEQYQNSDVFTHIHLLRTRLATTSDYWLNENQDCSKSDIVTGNIPAC